MGRSVAPSNPDEPDGELVEHEEMAQLHGRHASALATCRLTRCADLFTYPKKLLRTPLEQATAHEINGRAGRTIRGSSRVALDAMVAGEAPSPPRERPLLLACSRGPKSLVALDYLSEKCARVYTIDGGITAWDQAGLPTQDVGS